MARVLLYCPTYKVNGIEQIEPETRQAISDLKFDGVLVKRIISESEYPPPNYENLLVHYQNARQIVLDEGYDALLTVEHDIIVPRDGLQKLWDADKPVIYGIYLFRGSGKVINVFRNVNAPAPDMSLSRFANDLKKAVEEEITKVSGTGNGCTLIRREVLEQIEFRRTDDDNAVPDMPFATDCMRLGIQQYAHFGVNCGHIIDDRTVWFRSDNDGINMTKVQALQNFVGSDSVKYVTDETYEMSDDLVRDYVRAGFISVLNHKYMTAVALGRKLIAVKPHQNKTDVLTDTLVNCGYHIMAAPLNPERIPKSDALLIDHDFPEYGHREIINKYHEMGVPAILYPHGAAPMLCWDGIHEPNENVTAALVTSKGHAEVMKRYGYPIPTHVIGWYLCPQKQWKATEGIKVLFAPIHPILGHIFMFPEDLEVNRRTYERLLELDGIELSVRHIGKLEDNGLWDAPGVEIHQGRTDNTFDDIDNADLVISNGTMAYMAVARGKPTIMMNQMTPAREPDIDTLERYESASVEKYEKYMRFPFDVDNDPDLGTIIRDACKREPKQWRNRFIGEQFDPGKFCDLIGELIRVD